MLNGKARRTGQPRRGASNTEVRTLSFFDVLFSSFISSLIPLIIQIILTGLLGGDGGTMM